MPAAAQGAQPPAMSVRYAIGAKKTVFAQAVRHSPFRGFPADRPCRWARSFPACAIPPLTSFRPLRPLTWALPPTPTAQHNSNLLSKAPLDRRACEAGAGVVRLEKNKSFLIPTRKRRFFARSGLKSVSSKNPPLTPSAQKRLFLLKRYDKLRCARSPVGSGRPFPRGYFRHTPWPLRLPDFFRNKLPSPWASAP